MNVSVLWHTPVNCRFLSFMNYSHVVTSSVIVSISLRKASHFSEGGRTFNFLYTKQYGQHKIKTLHWVEWISANFYLPWYVSQVGVWRVTVSVTSVDSVEWKDVWRVWSVILKSSRQFMASQSCSINREFKKRRHRWHCDWAADTVWLASLTTQVHTPTHTKTRLRANIPNMDISHFAI